ncbi:MAG: penicillin-binding transpeptidase domain-containing protein [Oscillospiraceae bacterium]
MALAPTLAMKKKLNLVVTSVILVCFAILIGRLAQLTIVNNKFYADFAAKQQLGTTKISANRGTIYDRNMGILAKSATVWDVAISPADMKEGEAQAIADKLSELLDVDKEMILEKSKKDSKYEVIKKKVEEEVADEIRIFKKDNGYNGVNLYESTKRYYPNNFLASSTIGFAGTDRGLYGLEAKYDKYLKGTEGYVVSAKNGLGSNMPMNFEQKHNATDGNNIVLTLDESIQYFLEKALSQAYALHNPRCGIAGIVMDVNTGEVLGMANMPNFDLNNPYEITSPDIKTQLEALVGDPLKEATTKAQQNQWINKAISYTYQPGSVFKPITGAAAYEEKITNMNQTYFCPGYIQVADKRMRCHQAGGHGTINFNEAMVGSCNPAFVTIGTALGPNLFYDYVKNFGFTEKTGIDLPVEGDSSYYTASKLGPVELASCSFGQSLGVTAIQMITGVSAVINGGNLMQPYLVKEIQDANGNIISSTKPVVKRQVISKETSEVMRGILENVVKAGGGVNAYIRGQRVGGKSGTSQKQNPGDSVDARISSYYAFAPANEPKYAVYVMVDEPQSGEIYGSVVAAPIASSILSDVLNYYGVAPQYSEEEIKNLEISVPLLKGKDQLSAQSKLSAAGITQKPKIVGEGTVVAKQVPSAGSKIPADGTVIIYMADIEEKTVTVPNLIGMSPRVAKQTLSNASLNYLLQGGAGLSPTAKVTAQNIAAGKSIPEGTIIELTCVTSDTD